MMIALDVKNALCLVLQNIQTASALACPALHGKVKPVEDLPEFDSKIWPVAIAMLADALKVEIEDDVNIFREERGRRALTLDEAVEMVMKVAKPMSALAEQSA